ncbi:NADH:flavin oxidoreductase/NADH oxidase [Microvirga sp. TS319]|uniref:NADH:flavin oxidoreductase/NADH oxidase n=1 Tax=Microvirga sp. TS319 TaxID=3241165 RepID=UPI00351A701F
MTQTLFSPLDLGPVRVPNRIAVAPMCQYSAHDGCASDWHLQHLMTLAMSGAGLVMLEATAVERAGRITHGCLGLYSDENERALDRVLKAARSVALPGTRFGVQISHAGRKGSAQRPWEGGGPLAAHEDPWMTVAPSPLPHDAGWHVPRDLEEVQIEGIIQSFVQAARRAERLGFDVVELHMAHGYLLHQFHSPLSNRRHDRWGDSSRGRMALPLAVAHAVREAVSSDIAVGARITGTDWETGGLGVGDAVDLARALEAAGLAYLDVTSGGMPTKAPIAVHPGYQVPLAEAVKSQSRTIVRAVGLIVSPDHANEIITSNQADQVAIGRGLLDNPRWAWHAAEQLGIQLPRPPQYDRARPAIWPGAQQRNRAA